jgi:hypothetical protein
MDMKKILLVMAIVLPVVFTSCSKDDSKEENESGSQTVMVNVFYKYENDQKEHTANPTLLRLYKQNKNEIDFEESVSSMWMHRGDVTLKDGTVAIPEYTSDSFLGINTIEGVKNGNYTVIAFFKPDGYEWSFSYYYGYKEITVSNETGMQLYKIVFTWGSDNDAGKFVSK